LRLPEFAQTSLETHKSTAGVSGEPWPALLCRSRQVRRL